MCEREREREREHIQHCMSMGNKHSTHSLKDGLAMSLGEKVESRYGLLCNIHTLNDL